MLCVRDGAGGARDYGSKVIRSALLVFLEDRHTSLMKSGIIARGRGSNDVARISVCISHEFQFLDWQGRFLLFVMSTMPRG